MLEAQIIPIYKKRRFYLVTPPPPLNVLNKHKRAMMRATKKPQDPQLKIFAARLMKLNNYIPLFVGSSNSKKMIPEVLNEILIHSVPNSWVK